MQTGGQAGGRSGSAFKHCCDLMEAYLASEDAILFYWPRVREYAIPVHDGGSSGIVITFCPWCGSKLPGSVRGQALQDTGL
jgi:hypothetical protein